MTIFPLAPDQTTAGHQPDCILAFLMASLHHITYW